MSLSTDSTWLNPKRLRKGNISLYLRYIYYDNNKCSKHTGLHIRVSYYIENHENNISTYWPCFDNIAFKHNVVETTVHLIITSELITLYNIVLGPLNFILNNLRVFFFARWFIFCKTNYNKSSQWQFPLNWCLDDRLRMGKQ